jgi:nucleolar protein 14
MAPRFDPNYSGRKYGRPGVDEDPEAETRKLKAMYKTEKKAAVKELRKDNRFLAAEKARRQNEKDSEYNERMARTVGVISSERAEQKQMQRMKSIAKLRAGKKK